MNKKKWIAAGSITLIVLGIYVFGHLRNAKASLNTGRGLNGAEGGPGSAETQAKVFGVEKVRFTDAINGLIGTVKGDTIELTFGGSEEKLIAVHVEVGQMVQKGDKLFELDHTRSEARKNQAEVAWDRARQLQAVGGATANDVKEAKAAYDVARKDYEDTFIYAPKKGYVSDIHKHVGEVMARNEAIANLVSMEDRFYVETGVVEGQIEQVSKGQSAVVEIDAYGDHKIQGFVQGVSREVTTTGRTGTVIINLPEYVQAKVRPGLSARCTITIFDRPALVIPRHAFDTQKSGVYAVGSDKKTVFRPIELGYATRDHIEVVKGLSARDRILENISDVQAEEGTTISTFGEDEHFKPSEK